MSLHVSHFQFNYGYERMTYVLLPQINEKIIMREKSYCFSTLFLYLLPRFRDIYTKPNFHIFSGCSGCSLRANCAFHPPSLLCIHVLPLLFLLFVFLHFQLHVLLFFLSVVFLFLFFFLLLRPGHNILRRCLLRRMLV